MTGNDIGLGYDGSDNVLVILYFVIKSIDALLYVCSHRIDIEIINCEINN